jgi:hypothetical protein
MTFVRNLDLALLALALPLFLVAGWPILGWATAAVIWGLWRGVGEWADRRAAAAAAHSDPRRMAGIAAGSMIGRGWLLALFTVHFTFKLILRPAEPHGPRTT